MTTPDPSLLSLNTATVRAQWTMPEIIDGCVRHGIGRIAPRRINTPRLIGVQGNPGLV